MKNIAAPKSSFFDDIKGKTLKWMFSHQIKSTETKINLFVIVKCTTSNFLSLFFQQLSPFSQTYGW